MFSIFWATVLCLQFTATLQNQSPMAGNLPSNENTAQNNPVKLASNEKNETEPVRRLTQPWTLDGYPIVDGKYLDLSTGELKTIGGQDQVGYGPPLVDAYWRNLGSGNCSVFGGFRHQFSKPVSEYLIRIGEALKKGDWKVFSMAVTEYSITVIVQTEMLRDEMMVILDEARVLGYD